MSGARCAGAGVGVRAISLFSGIGGFDLGFGKAGIETVLQVEQDRHALGVLARHWPDVERMTDVRDVGEASPGGERRGRGDVGGDEHRADIDRGRSAGRAGGYVDLIYGGFPCQDISVAGKRAGLSGERSGLWFEFARILGELRPRWCVIENVAGLLSSGSPPGGDLGVILDTLVELGYGVAWRTLDAQHFGVPQRRRRIFIVGGPGDGTAASAVLALREGGGGDPAAGVEAREGVAGTITGSARAAGAGGDPADSLIPALAGTFGMSGQSGGFRTSDLDGMGAFIPVTATSGVRRLTPLECERLMGFPDGWTEGQADSHRYRQLGNAVVVPVAEWIGHRLVRVDELLW